MNKTENVSIGRRGFVCDTDAYKVLQSYLERCAKSLSSDPDKEEILADLEASMASHLQELSGELVVDVATAERVISTMGEVEPVDLDDTDKSADHPIDSENNISFGERVKSLFSAPPYKDHEREIVDGICAGIAKALDVDPLWIRLLFVVLTFLTQGAMIVIYIVLAIIMKEEASYTKKTAGEVVETIRTKISRTAESARPYERFLRKLIGGVFIVLWTTLRVIVCVVLVLASIVWASYLFMMISQPDNVRLFGVRPGWLELMTVFSAGLLILIPLFELLVAMFKPKKRNKVLSIVVWTLWFACITTTVAGAANIYPRFEHYLKTEQPKNKYVYVQVVGNEIASLCISPLGTCTNTEQRLMYRTLCDREVVMYDRNDRPVWQSRGWLNEYKSFEYPVSQEVYCKEVQRIISAMGDSGEVMFANQDINSIEDVSMESISNNTLIPANKQFWHMEYATHF
jgi:phage shock protein PspC (stress-responsive transcriptional regulator)